MHSTTNLLQEFTRQAIYGGCRLHHVWPSFSSWIRNFPRVADLIFIVSVSFFGLILALAEYQARFYVGQGSPALLPREVIWRSLIIIGFLLIAREASVNPTQPRFSLFSHYCYLSLSWYRHF